MTHRPYCVLVVDDHHPTRQMLQDAFVEARADISVSVADCEDQAIAQLTEHSFDAVVLDKRMARTTSGLELAASIGIGGRDMPAVYVIYTGFPDHNFRECVGAMRSGAWDYIIKEATETVPSANRVVDSVTNRLDALAIRNELEQVLASWLPRHLSELESKYTGKIVALWFAGKDTSPQADLEPIGAAENPFVLNEQLSTWRSETSEREFVLPFFLDLRN